MTERVDIVFRFVEKYSDIDTVKEHQKVIDEKGAAWLGKVGRGLSEKTVFSLNEQCKEGTTYFYMARLIGTDYVMHRATLLEVRKSLPMSEQKLVPAYYAQHRVTPFVGLWFKISDMQSVSAEEVGKFKVKSSGLRLVDTMKGSPASLFFLNQTPS